MAFLSGRTSREPAPGLRRRSRSEPVASSCGVVWVVSGELRRCGGGGVPGGPAEVRNHPGARIRRRWRSHELQPGRSLARPSRWGLCIIGWPHHLIPASTIVGVGRDLISSAATPHMRHSSSSHQNTQCTGILVSFIGNPEPAHPRPLDASQIDLLSPNRGRCSRDGGTSVSGCCQLITSPAPITQAPEAPPATGAATSQVWAAELRGFA